MGGGCCVGNCCVMDNAVGNFFRNLFGSSSSGCGYTPSVSENEVHAKKIAGELADMKENMRKSSEEVEKDIAIDIVTSMSEFIKELEKINNKPFGDVVLKLNIKAIKEKNDALKNSVKGTVADYIDGMLIQTNNELSTILEERDDKKREKGFKKFCDKIQNQAVEILKKKITDTVNAQEEIIRKELNARIGEVEKSSADTLEILTQQQASKEAGDTKYEATMFHQMYISELCSILIDDIANEG